MALTCADVRWVADHAPSVDKEDVLQLVGFITMVLMLIHIIKATTVHPKTGILIGTIRYASNHSFAPRISGV